MIPCCLILYLGIELFNLLVFKQFLGVGNVGRHGGSLVQSTLPKTDPKLENKVGTFCEILLSFVIHPLNVLQNLDEFGSDVLNHGLGVLFSLLLEVLFHVKRTHRDAQAARMNGLNSHSFGIAFFFYLPVTMSMHSFHLGSRSVLPERAVKYFSWRLRTSSVR
jgi:hypothetical protein